jgi:hypothetical protein
MFDLPLPVPAYADPAIGCLYCLDSGRTIDTETLDVVPCPECKAPGVAGLKWPRYLRGLLAWWDEDEPDEGGRSEP